MIQVLWEIVKEPLLQAILRNITQSPAEHRSPQKTHDQNSQAKRGKRQRVSYNGQDSQHRLPKHFFLCTQDTIVNITPWRISYLTCMLAIFTSDLKKWWFSHSDWFLHTMLELWSVFQVPLTVHSLYTLSVAPENDHQQCLMFSV